MNHTTHAVPINCQCSSWGLSLRLSLQTPLNEWNSFIYVIATCPGYCHLHNIKKFVLKEEYEKIMTLKITILFVVNILCRSWNPISNIQQKNLQGPLIWINLLHSKTFNLNKLTSFQDFPWARRGYKGALGLANNMKFETATSLGCKIQ